MVFLWLAVIGFGLLGLFIFWLIAQVLILEGQQESEYKALESHVSMSQHLRTHEKIVVLNAIRETPADQREGLWNWYHDMDEQDRALINQERARLVNASGFTITEHEQYELDHGINPYKKRSTNG